MRRLQAMIPEQKLKQALADPIWISRRDNPELTFSMDGQPDWRIAYYPIFECGKTGEQYSEPRALVERKTTFEGKEGTDFREVPLRYLTPIKP